MINPAPAKTPMTDEDRDLINLLRGCTFLPGSFDKRFVRSLAALADHPERPPISDRQREQLRRLTYKYRRQILRNNGV